MARQVETKPNPSVTHGCDMPRARARSFADCHSCHSVTAWDSGCVTCDCDTETCDGSNARSLRDRTTGLAPVRPVTAPARRDRHSISVDPWPQYDDIGRPWWPVRVVGPHGDFTVFWSSREGRFSGGSETRRMKSVNGRLLYAAQLVAQQTFGARA